MILLAYSKCPDQTMNMHIVAYCGHMVTKTIQCHVYTYLTLEMLITNAADDIIIIFFYFSEKKGLTFHVHRLPGRRCT